MTDVRPADDAAFPTLDDTQLERLAGYGEPRHLDAGEYAFVEGEAWYDFVVVLAGEIEVLRRGPDGEVAEVIATHGPGKFIGELSLLTGQRATLAARALSDAEVLVLPALELRRFMASETELADLVFAALVARRELMRHGSAARTVRLFGSQYSPDALAIRGFLRRNQMPHEWIDLDGPEVDDAAVLLATVGARLDDAPVVVTPTAVLRRATPGSVSSNLGLVHTMPSGSVKDVIVVGGGPGGLAAAVYGASEGLSTLLMDKVGVGGQAGTSSRIENYLGFPSGVSGGELVERAALQAQRLGAKLTTPCRVVELRRAGGAFELVAEDGATFAARAVVLAMGVHYRKLPIAELERFEGAGVYYAATDLEVRTCGAQPVTVVGGGNSAGQAALFLAARAGSVRIVIRGGDLTAKMSRYLYDRIVAASNIEVTTACEVTALHGDGHLEGIDLTTPDGARSVPCHGLFSFIGAVPSTGWLPPELALDPAGFVRTDRDLLPEERPDGDPLPYETSMPGVFAVGDVRVGSMKRVAAAVGEGSSAIRSVHDHLAGHPVPG